MCWKRLSRERMVECNKAVWRGTIVAAKEVPTAGNEKVLANELSVYRYVDHRHTSEYIYKLQALFSIFSTASFTPIVPQCTVFLKRSICIMFLVDRSLNHPNLLTLLRTLSKPFSLTLITNFVKGRTLHNLIFASEKKVCNCKSECVL